MNQSNVNILDLAAQKLENKEPKQNPRQLQTDGSRDKILTDFFLLTQCKYFIVGPSTFHWWGAWLANFEDKICVRPKNLNPSNNKDFWPEKWVII